MSVSDDMTMALDTLRREGVPLLASEIAKWNLITPSASRRALQKLAQEGVVSRNDNGYWALQSDGSDYALGMHAHNEEA